MALFATKAEAIAAAAQVWARICADLDAKSPEQVARDAYIAGGPSLEEIADNERRLRAEALERQSLPAAS